MEFSAILATTQKGGLGLKNALPWRIRGDLKMFKLKTNIRPGPNTAEDAPRGPNAVIMGRRTWESLPEQYRPLPRRLNVVLSSNPDLELPEGVGLSSSLDAALEYAQQQQCYKAFVIGGASVYREAFTHPNCVSVYHTLVLKDMPCDVFVDLSTLHINLELSEIGNVEPQSKNNVIPYQINTWTRKVEAKQALEKPHEEQQYLELIRRVIATGAQRGDRTGTGTLSIFGAQARYSLRDGTFPLLTTKRVFWRGVAEELLWLIKGSTDSNALAEKKVHIWDGNGTRAFLDKCGFPDRKQGDLGPVYGFQWRFCGAKYVDAETNYTGQGIDQLANLIHTIKTNPNDRRILMSAWNPVDVPQMALPPCHVLCQFYVANGELSCQMYQRSCDLGLGVPFNIASYALLTCMIAHVCGLKPGDFVHVMGDAHVYLNHVEALKKQLERTPRAFPTLSFKRTVTNIDDFTFDDLVLENYKPHKKIAMKMAV